MAAVNREKAKRYGNNVGKQGNVKPKPKEGANPEEMPYIEWKKKNSTLPSGDEELIKTLEENCLIKDPGTKLSDIAGL
jgi:hypothetical protein